MTNAHGTWYVVLFSVSVSCIGKGGIMVRMYHVCVVE